MSMYERDAVGPILAEIEDISVDTEQRAKKRLKELLFRALNYLAISVFILVVYGSFLLTDYALFWLITWLLREEVKKYSYVALWFDYARIGLAFLLILCAFIHGVLSAISQVKWDLAMSKEVENI